MLGNGGLTSAAGFNDAMPIAPQNSPAFASGMLRRLQHPAVASTLDIEAIQPTPKVQLMSSMRITKVFIADINDNLPLDKRVLYSGDEKLTDLTDQELFFEVPITDLLAKHNAVRAATVDKKQAEKFGRDIFLEPARIRDLRMVVVDVAKF